jgi:hypothetical protein
MTARIHFRPILFLALAVVLVTISGSAAQAPADSLKSGYTDKATLKILQDGKEIGKEAFQIQLAQGQWKSTADISLQHKGQGPIQIHAETVLDEKHTFVSYEAQRTGEGPKMKIRVNLEDGIAICEEKGDYTSETNPVKVEPNFQLLDTNVFHHYALLALRLTRNPQTSQFQVLIPQEAVAGDLKVKGTSKETLKVGKNRIAVQRFDLDSGQIQLTLWADSEGRLHKILVPQTHAEVVRIE